MQVAVGHDPRVSAPLLGPAVLSGLVSAGAEAVDVGLATTPAMFYGIVAPGKLVPRPSIQAVAVLLVALCAWDSVVLCCQTCWFVCDMHDMHAVLKLLGGS